MLQNQLEERKPIYVIIHTILNINKAFPMEESLFKQYLYDFARGNYTEGKEAAQTYQLGYINEDLKYMKISATSVSS
jgi:hypothetical protein